MIVKSDIGHLPPTLRAQFANGVARNHPLWRIANQGLSVGDLDKRIEFQACMATIGSSERAFKINLADTDTLAARINDLATNHKLSKSRVFEILVHLGWDALQSYGTQIGRAPLQSQPVATSQPAMTAPAPVQTTIALPHHQETPVAAAPAIAVAPAEPEFCDTPEFASIAQNMLAQFNIDMSIAAPAQS